MPTYTYDADSECDYSENDGQPETLSQLIQNYPLTRQPKPKSALTNCIKTGNLTQLKAILSQRIQRSKQEHKPTIPEDSTDKLLIQAIRYDQPPVLRYLLNLPARYRPDRHKNRDFPIRYASERNHLNCLQQLLTYSSIDHNQHPLCIKRALYTACCFSRIQIIDFLVTRFKDVLTPNSKNTIQFALLLAIECNKPQVVNYLLNHNIQFPPPHAPKLLHAFHTAGEYLALRATKLIAFKLLQTKTLPNTIPQWLEKSIIGPPHQFFLTQKNINAKKIALRKYLMALQFIQAELKDKPLHRALQQLSTAGLSHNRKTLTHTCFLALQHYNPITAPALRDVLLMCYQQAITNTLFWSLPLDITRHILTYVEPQMLRVRGALKKIILPLTQQKRLTIKKKNQLCVLLCHQILHPFTGQTKLTILAKKTMPPSFVLQDALDELMNLLDNQTRDKATNSTQPSAATCSR